MEKILLDPKSAPDESLLKTTLGDSFPFFLSLSGECEGFPGIWKFYGKKSGWGWKSSWSGKTLIWIFPYSGCFLSAFSLRDGEREVLLKENLPDDCHDQLENGKKYPEGYALRILVDSEESAVLASQILNIVKKMRN